MGSDAVLRHTYEGAIDTLNGFRDDLEIAWRDYAQWENGYSPVLQDEFNITQHDGFSGTQSVLRVDGNRYEVVLEQPHPGQDRPEAILGSLYRRRDGALDPVTDRLPITESLDTARDAFLVEQYTDWFDAEQYRDALLP